MQDEYRRTWELAGGSAPSHWGYSSLEELLDNPKAIAVGVMYPGRNTENGVPLIKVADVKNGRVIAKPDFLISKEKDYEYRRTRIKGKELFITLVGNPGDCVLATPEMVGWNVARAIAALRLKDSELREWVRYICLSHPAQHFFDSRLNTTVQKTLNLKDIKELVLPIPPKDERKIITQFINAIEQKIELNRQINATLEAIAQALFKSWFVDFDPVIDNALVAGNPIPEPLQARAAARKALGDQRKPLPEAIQKHFCDRFIFNDDLGWVPEEWDVAYVGDILDLAYGKSLPAEKRVEGNISVFGSGGVSGLHNEALVSGPGVVVGRKGTVGSLYWVEKDFFPIDTVFYVVNKSGAPLYWLYQVLGLFDIKLMGADSAVPGVNRNVVYAKKLTLATAPVFDEYESRIQTLLMRQEKLRNQSEVLELLRDTLLPKLLSGQLRISDAEKRVAEAL